MKKLKLLTLVALLIASLVMPLGAQAVSLKANYSPASTIVRLSGSSNGVTALRVTKYSTELAALSDGNPPIDYHQFVADGSINFEFRLPEGTQYGKYMVTVVDSEANSAADTFLYYDKSAADAIARSLTVSNFMATVTSNPAALGIDVDAADYNPEALSLMNRLYTSYADSTVFYERYCFTKAIVAIEGTDHSHCESLLEKYQLDLGIDYTADYQSNALLSSDAKRELTRLLASTDYASNYESAQSVTGESCYRAMLDAMSAIAVINTSSGWKAKEKVYTTDFAFLSSNVMNANSAYKSSMATGVFMALNEMSFSLPSHLKSNFDDAVASPVSDGGQSAKPGRPTQSTFSPSVLGAVTGFDSLPVQETGTDATPVKVSLPTSDGSNVSYYDVPADSWYAPAVSSLSASGIISGDATGSYRPADNITRAEFTKLIVAAFSVEGGSELSFDDVADGEWYAPYVKRAAASGIISGYDGLFRPQDYISRQDAALILYRLTGLFDLEYAGYEEPADMDSASIYAWTAIGAFYKNGIVKGDASGNFNPLSSITRAESAQLIYNLINDMTQKIG